MVCCFNAELLHSCLCLDSCEHLTPWPETRRRIHWGSSLSLRSATRWTCRASALWSWMKTAPGWTQRSSSRRCLGTLPSWSWRRDRGGPPHRYEATSVYPLFPLRLNPLDGAVGELIFSYWVNLWSVCRGKKWLLALLIQKLWKIHRYVCLNYRLIQWLSDEIQSANSLSFKLNREVMSCIVRGLKSEISFCPRNLREKETLRMKTNKSQRRYGILMVFHPRAINFHRNRSTQWFAFSPNVFFSSDTSLHRSTSRSSQAPVY